MPMNFAVELQRLLQAENPPPVDPISELMKTQTGVLDSILKNGDNLSLQVEEIYDIIKDSDENAREVKSAAKRENTLLSGFVAMSDLTDGLLQYLQEHSGTITAKKDEIMNACGVERLGLVGERLDPRTHTVAAAEFSDAPIESVIRVLEHGYAYRGKVVRKATVILSKGAEIV